MRFGFLVALLCAGPAMAQDWKMRDGDVLLPVDALSEQLSGQALVFFDEGRSIFETNGQYQYIYAGGGTWYGYWAVEEAGLVCVTFVTGVERCDRIVENGGKLVVLTSDGQRFPVRGREKLASEG